MLEEQDLVENDMNAVHVEKVQAWILITFYEFLRCSKSLPQSPSPSRSSKAHSLRLVLIRCLHNCDANYKMMIQATAGLGLVRGGSFVLSNF